MLWTGVGYVDEDHYWGTKFLRDVNSAKSNVAVQFTPILSAYITGDYKATEMLR
ncbi:hypothetical protein RhiTH_011754, partial [Rhizoctonia solani]